MEYVHAAELELEQTRRALSEAHQAYSLAKRKLKKAQAAYFASRAYEH
jgi:TfoX/Sxy family transcriptional regulator of competence genes